MRRLTHWFAAVCLTMAGTTAQAQDNPVVVELFTSQGCSSCPPADSVLAELGTHDDVIPLALHVDYLSAIIKPMEIYTVPCGNAECLCFQVLEVIVGTKQKQVL